MDIFEAWMLSRSGRLLVPDLRRFLLKLGGATAPPFFFLGGTVNSYRIRAGWITLEGSVEWNYQRERAEEAVRYLRGVGRLAYAGRFSRVELSGQLSA